MVARHGVAKGRRNFLLRADNTIWPRTAGRAAVGKRCATDESNRGPEGEENTERDISNVATCSLNFRPVKYKGRLYKEAHRASSELCNRGIETRIKFLTSH